MELIQQHLEDIKLGVFGPRSTQEMSINVYDGRHQRKNLCQLLCCSFSFGSSCHRRSSFWSNLEHLWAFSRKCVNSCPPGYFGDSLQRKCRRCHRGCEACLGRSQNSCTACKRGYYHHQETNTCVMLCPAGFYSEDGKNGEIDASSH